MVNTLSLDITNPKTGVTVPMVLKEDYDSLVEALRNIETWAASPGECALDVIRACVRRTLAKAGVQS